MDVSFDPSPHLLRLSQAPAVSAAGLGPAAGPLVWTRACAPVLTEGRGGPVLQAGARAHSLPLWVSPSGQGEVAPSGPPPEELWGRPTPRTDGQAPPLLVPHSDPSAATVGLASTDTQNLTFPSPTCAPPPSPQGTAPRGPPPGRRRHLGHPICSPPPPAPPGTRECRPSEPLLRSPGPITGSCLSPTMATGGEPSAPETGAWVEKPPKASC